MLNVKKEITKDDVIKYIAEVLQENLSEDYKYLIKNKTIQESNFNYVDFVKSGKSLVQKDFNLNLDITCIIK